MFVKDVKTNSLIKICIEKIGLKEIKSVSKEFSFDWVKLSKQKNSQTFALKLDEDIKQVLGLLHLTTYNGMLIMNLIQVSKNNIGKTKRYDYIAGCLIAFACKQSFEMETSYKGFLTFNAKSELIKLYTTKYYAKQINGQRMYIDPESGVKLINQYLNRSK